MYGLKGVKNRRGDDLSRIAWDQLEVLLASYYRCEGFDVDHVGTGAGSSKFDGGIDLKLRRNDQYIIVQCKHWNAYKVPHNAVHELLGIMVNQRATGAILVTSGEFTKAANEAATRQGHVQLIDGDELRAMLGPLTEPDGAAPSMRAEASRTGRFAASSVGREVGERLLRAAEDGIRAGFRGRSGAPRVSASASLLFMVLKFVLIALMVVVFSLVIRKVFANLQTSLRTTTERAASQPASLPAPPAQGYVAQAAGADVPVALDSDNRAVRVGPTAAEVREAQRKADEAMKVLEATTPEM